MKSAFMISNRQIFSLAILGIVFILQSCGSHRIRPEIHIISTQPLGRQDAPLTDTLKRFISMEIYDGQPVEPIVILSRIDLGVRDTFSIEPQSYKSKQRIQMGIRELGDAERDFSSQIGTFRNSTNVSAPAGLFDPLSIDTADYDFFLVSPTMYEAFGASNNKKFSSVDKLNDAVRASIINQIPSALAVEDQVSLKVLIVNEAIIPSSCSDGIKNGQETDIDCGGPDCISCCEDGIRNGKEVDIDCGGDCVPCCEDGKKNNGETGIDCGGPKCQPCPPRVVSMDVRPDGLYDIQKKLQRAVQNLDWEPVPEASKYVLRFTTKGGKLKEWTVPKGSIKSLSLITLGFGTTDDVWEMTIRGYDSSDRLVGKGGLNNFTISCN